MSKTTKTVAALIVAVVILALAVPVYAVFSTGVYKDQGGDRLVVASGGTLLVESGGTLTIDDGALAPGDIALAEGSVLVGNASTVAAALDASTTTQILIGNGTTITSAALSGDVTMDNAGDVTIAGTSVENSMLAGSIADAKLSSSLAKRPATLAWGALYMTGIGVDQELLTLNGRIYELDTDSTVDNGGDVLVDVSGGVSADQTIAALVTAINGDSATGVIDAVGDATNDILFLYADTTGTAGNSLTVVEAYTNGDVQDSTLNDGTAAAVAAVVSMRHTITTTEATGGATAAIRFDTGLTSIDGYSIFLNNAGVVDDGALAVSISAGVLTVVEGTAWANNDILEVIVVGTE